MKSGSRRKSAEKPKPTRAEENIKWIEEFCRTPEGRYVGKPIKLRDWQKAALKKIYDNPHGTRQAIISMPRKNGKTALISFLLLLHLCGPEAKANSQLYSSAQSKEQAATVFKLAARIVRQSPNLAAVITIRDTIKELVCLEMGTIYAALSAETSTAYGKSPIFAVHDELGQVDAATSELYNAVETGMGAHEAPLSIIISTQAATDGALLSMLIDKALTEVDPHTTLTMFSAPLDADPFSEETLKACNPAWGDFLNDKEVIRTMEAAKALPSQEASYRNLHLNQRIEGSSPFVSLAVWRACGDAPRPLKELSTHGVYGGLDLSAVDDLTALVLIGWSEDKWHAHPTFWLPAEGLHERSRTDRVPYDIWQKQGHIEGVPGKSVDYEYVARWLRQLILEQGINVKKIGFDPWKFGALKQWLLKVGFSDTDVDKYFVEVGQGYKSMTPALRTLEVELLNKRLAHGNHPVLSMCAENAVVQIDPAGNRKLNKSKSIRRIDGMVSLAMAFSVAEMPTEKEPTYQMLVL